MLTRQMRYGWRRIEWYLSMLVSLGLMSVRVAEAQVYHVTMDTSSLYSLGSYYLEYQLVDGSATGGDGNSQAIISNFQLVGGALGAVLNPTIGNATGALPESLSLVDGPLAFGDVADFAQALTVSSHGSTLSFDLILSSTGVDTPFPDKFSFFVLDGTQNPLPTDGPNGVELVSADFLSISPQPTGYSTTTVPNLIATVSANSLVPEPGILTLLAAGTLSFCSVATRKRQSCVNR